MTDYATRLTEARAALAAGKAAIASADYRPSTHEADQLRAATHEATAMVHQLAELLEVPLDGIADPARQDEVRARTLVAIDGARPCHHARRGQVQALTARLPLARIDCRWCVRQAITPPPEDAHRCDWCRRDGVEVFKPVAYAVGALSVVGDACLDCASALAGRAKARTT